jgi:hypothetical protein
MGSLSAGRAKDPEVLSFLRVEPRSGQNAAPVGTLMREALGMAPVPGAVGDAVLSTSEQ